MIQSSASAELNQRAPTVATEDFFNTIGPKRPSPTGRLRSVRGTPIQPRRVVLYFGQSHPSILIEFDDAASVGGDSKFAAAEFNSRQEVHGGGKPVHNRRIA